MKGAKPYTDLFRTGQHGKLFFVSGEHARGKTFSIWILPSSVPVKGMPWTVKDAIEVYGAVSGQLGWTETYGWIHKGRWCEDVHALVEARQKEIAEAQAEREKVQAEKDSATAERKASLLAAY